jgi:hypothetical protein
MRRNKELDADGRTLHPLRLLPFTLPYHRAEVAPRSNKHTGAARVVA